MNQRDHPRREDDGRPSEMSSRAHRSEFDCGQGKSLSICVVEAVSEAIGTDPVDMQPLYEVIDPDALDELFETSHQLQRGCIIFQFAGCNVSIDADEWITVSPRITDTE